MFITIELHGVSSFSQNKSSANQGAGACQDLAQWHGYRFLYNKASSNWGSAAYRDWLCRAIVLPSWMIIKDLEDLRRTNH